MHLSALPLTTILQIDVIFNVFIVLPFFWYMVWVLYPLALPITVSYYLGGFNVLIALPTRYMISVATSVICVQHMKQHSSPANLISELVVVYSTDNYIVGNRFTVELTSE